MMVSSRQELDAAFALAESQGRLVCLTAYSEDVCDLGAQPEGWETRTNELQDDYEPCARVGQALANIAKECKDVAFVELEGDADSETRALCSELGIKTFPTFQYWRDHEMLFAREGAGGTSVQDIQEAILYFGNSGAGGEDVGEFVPEINSKAELDDWLQLCALPGTSAVTGQVLSVPCDKQLCVLDVSNQKDSPVCMHLYPSVVALAKNTAGAVRWGRLLADRSPETAAVAQQLNVTQTPTFVFFADGKVVGSYVGSDRMQLVEFVLKWQKQQGVKLPEPAPRKRMSTAEAKEIARKKRAAQGRLSGW